MIFIQLNFASKGKTVYLYTFISILKNIALLLMICDEDASAKKCDAVFVLFTLFILSWIVQMHAFLVQICHRCRSKTRHLAIFIIK